MLEYYRRKLPHLIALFARLHLERAKRPLTMTQLFKYLALLDFSAVRTWGRPSTGLDYIALPYGPVPEELYEDLKQKKTYDADLYQVVQKDKTFLIYPGKKPPELGYLSDWEKKEVEQLIEVYAEQWVKAEHMSEASHQKIKAWKKAFDRGVGTPIDMMEELEDIEDEAKKSLLSERLETFLTLNKT